MYSTSSIQCKYLHPLLSKYPRIPQLPLQSRGGLYSTSSIQCKYLHPPPPPPPPRLSIPGFPSYLYSPGMDCTVPPVYSASTCLPCLSIPGFPSYLYNPGMDCIVPPVYSASTCPPPLSKYPRIPQLPLQSRDGLYIQCKYLPPPPPLSKYPRIPQLPLQSRGGLYSTSSIQCKYLT